MENEAQIIVSRSPGGVMKIEAMWRRKWFVFVGVR
jgi:hypothetical protein